MISLRVGADRTRVVVLEMFVVIPIQAVKYRSIIPALKRLRSIKTGIKSAQNRSTWSSQAIQRLLPIVCKGRFFVSPIRLMSLGGPEVETNCNSGSTKSLFRLVHPTAQSIER